jgi:C-terminal processing protease CtpA/Prc
MRLSRFLVAAGLAALVHVFGSVSAHAAEPAPDLDFEKGEAGEAPAGWFVPSAGWKAELSASEHADGAMSAKLYVPGEVVAQFGNLMRQIPAAEYRGKKVILRSKVRVDGSGRAQMWLRVDRAGGQMGAFDNMGERPIMPGGWTDARIEADVDDDAESINVGFLVLGGTPAVYVDAVKLEVSDEKPAARQAASEPLALSERGLANVAAGSKLLAYVRFFCASDQSAGVKAWDHFAIDLMGRVEDAKDPIELAERLKAAFRPLAPTLEVWPAAADVGFKAEVPAGATRLAFWHHDGCGVLSDRPAMNVYKSWVEYEPLGAGSKAPAGAGEGAPAASADPTCFVTKDLGGGVYCRLPVKVYADDQGTLPRGQTPEAWASTKGKEKLTALNRGTRLAGVATAWGIFQHFYPYFDVAMTDWNAALTDGLRKAATDVDERAYRETLAELVAKLHDGHGAVMHGSSRAGTFLPLALAWAGSGVGAELDELTVVGAVEGAAPEIRRGDVIVSIDGVASAEIYRDVCRRISFATDGWARYISPFVITTEYKTADPAVISLRHPDGTAYSVSVARGPRVGQGAVVAARPANGSEVAPGIVYFNLDQGTSAQLSAAMPALEKAKAIIFDLRGYPADGAYELMSHLIDAPATSAQWNIPTFLRPDQESVKWNTSGWDLRPKEPRLKAPVAFLTYGGAISYAESIMGIVENYKFGEIVGANTAGTNGNVNPFVLPGDYRISWTGMKVLKHDGTRHHGVGIRPTVPVNPTPKGIAENRDEVLAKGIEVMEKKIAEGGGAEKPER